MKSSSLRLILKFRKLPRTFASNLRNYSTIGKYDLIKDNSNASNSEANFFLLKHRLSILQPYYNTEATILGLLCIRLIASSSLALNLINQWTPLPSRIKSHC